MSQELIKARSLLSQVRTLLKQQKHMLAVQALHDGLLIVLRNPLMKQEKEEFARLLEEAAYQLDSNAGFHQLVPLKITYVQGREKELLLVLRQCLDELRNSAVGDAKQQLEDLEKQRAEGLEKGRELVQNQEYDHAKEFFQALVKEFPSDAELKAEIGDIYLKAQLYEDAYTYLSQALEDSPTSLHLYNRIGIALRKMGLFETAEKYYFKALEIHNNDANLYFNIGRLYVDWERWDKVAEMATKALELAPSFDQAQKMLAFARKRL